MLQYEVANEDARASGTILVLLHGRGANRHDLLTLARKLPGRVVVSPEAPFPAAPWGYGTGSAWYRFLGRNKPEPESFESSLARLHEFLTALPRELGLDAPHIDLGGFSQGGTLSLAYALTHPGVIPHVLNFSGFLADHPLVQATAETVRGSRFFWGHGTADANIPFALAIEGRAALESAGAELVSADYNIGHWIDAEEISDALGFLNADRGSGIEDRG